VKEVTEVRLVAQYVWLAGGDGDRLLPVVEIVPSEDLRVFLVTI
jgi:hypothetical protein